MEELNEGDIFEFHSEFDSFVRDAIQRQRMLYELYLFAELLKYFGIDVKDLRHTASPHIQSYDLVAKEDEAPILVFLLRGVDGYCHIILEKKDVDAIYEIVQKIESNQSAKSRAVFDDYDLR